MEDNARNPSQRFREHKGNYVDNYISELSLVEFL